MHHLKEIEIWNQEKWKEFRNLTVDDLPVCKKCDDKYICGGGCRAHAYYSHNGDYLSNDPISCLTVKFVLENAPTPIKESLKNIKKGWNYEFV